MFAELIQSDLDALKESLGFDSYAYTHNVSDQITEYEGCRIVAYVDSNIDLRSVDYMKGKPSSYDSYITINYLFIFKDLNIDNLLVNILRTTGSDVKSAETRQEVLQEKYLGKDQWSDSQFIEISTRVSCPLLKSNCLLETCLDKC